MNSSICHPPVHPVEPSVSTLGDVDTGESTVLFSWFPVLTTTQANNGDAYYFFNESFYGDVDLAAFSEEIRACLIALYAITTAVALVGNLIVVVTLATGTTFWKLRHFLLNLAVSDLLITIFCLPFTFTKALVGKWHFGDFMCSFVTFVQYLAVSVSVFTNVAIGLDRYGAVVRPMQARLTTGRVRLVMATVWVFGLAVSAPQLKVSQQIKNEIFGFYDCIEEWNAEALLSRAAYKIAVFTITYAIPFFILTVTYSTVGLRLWERTHPGEAYTIRDQRQRQSKTKVIKMLVTIVIAFGLCWLPLHLFNLLRELRPGLFEDLSLEQQEMVIGSYLACHWVAMAHSTVNPIIYGFMHEKFRKDVRIIFYTCCRCCSNISGRAITSRAFRIPTDTNDTTDRESHFRFSRKTRTSSTNSSSRSRAGTFTLGCGLRRQDTIEDNRASLPHPQHTDMDGPLTERTSTSYRAVVTSV